MMRGLLTYTCSSRYQGGLPEWAQHNGHGRRCQHQSTNVLSECLPVEVIRASHGEPVLHSHRIGHEIISECMGEGVLIRLRQYVRRCEWDTVWKHHQH